MSAVLRNPLPEPSAVFPGNVTVGAVVVGGDYQGLGIVRSLGSRGIPVCVVDDEYSISRFSRYSTHHVRLSDLRDERAVVDNLLDVAKRFNLRGWVLYPTREELVAAISHSRTELSEWFRVPTPEWHSVRWAWDKRNTYRLAADLAIPAPITYYPNSVAELADLDKCAPPFVIKPAIKEHFVYATKVKAWRANTHADLERLFLMASELAGAGEVMVQELIPGGGQQQFSYCAFFRNGNAVGKMVARRWRQHPLEFGRASTYVETADVPVLEELSERFLRAIDYYGLVEIEFKLDPRDGQYKLLDVNARTWGYHSLGPRAGVDFSYMLYADQIGLAVASCKGQSGVSWMRTTTDIPAALVALWSGDLDLKSYLSTLKRCNVEAVFSHRDPLPGIAELMLVPYLAIKRGF